ncbi:MAG: malectin domain-containing carbohydrate-binding protein, partial [Pseudomonadota bacterium]
AGTADTDAVVATLAFSEAITALDSADVTLTVPTVEGGTIDRGDGVVALAGDGLSATVTFAAPTQGFANGTYTVAVADAAVADAAGNTSAAVTGTVDVALSLGTDERYDENVNGDLSDDNTDPTDLPAFVEGSNIVTLFASDGNGDETGVPTDRDYFTIEVPTGFELSALTLVDYAAGGGSDNAAFIAISDEETINFTAEDIFSTQTEPANSNLIGGLLIGATEVGTDILADLGSGVVAGSGFDGPLGAGVYTVWLNQNADVSRASLDFELTPVAAPTNTVGDVVLAINSTGPSTEFEIDGELISFLSDQGPDKPANVTAAGNTFTDSNGGNGQQTVFDGTPFETERFGGNLSYTITDLEPGQYAIDLLFAELFQSEAGDRVFDIQINESNVLGPFDILAETGGDINQSIISRVSAVVELGAGDDLVISGVNIVDNAKLNGFVIREATDERPVIQVADAPDALEAGDDGDTVLVFPITLSEPALGDVSVEVDVTIDGTTTTQTVNLGPTGGSIDVAVPNDAELTGPRDVTIAVTSVVAGDAFARIPIEGIVGGITASSTVADDEADVDGDTLLNADDPFAFDASNGLNSVLEAGGEITFDFNTDA